MTTNTTGLSEMDEFKRRHLETVLQAFSDSELLRSDDVQGALYHAIADLFDVAAEHEQSALDAEDEGDKRMCEYIARRHREHARTLRSLLVQQEADRGD